MKKILVIDDEAMVLDVIKIIFEDMGYSVTIHSSSEEGCTEAIANDYDLILTDLRMPIRNGAETTECILAAKPKAKILVITAFPSDPLAHKALKAGAIGLVQKPFEIAKILEYLKD